jgi:phage regulator Rha-like protein
MESLVKMHNGEIMVDSRVIANKFTNGKHAYVKDAIKTILKKMEKTKGRRSRPSILKYIIQKDVYRGQEYDYYLLNRAFYSMVSMKFRTDDAFIWQEKFIEAFFEMERKLLRQSDAEWLTARKQSKEIRKLETDTIKEFVEYAESQGSKNANKYYINITKTTAKTLLLLENQEPSTRNFLDKLELNQLIFAEMVVANSLKKYMSMEIPYKQIFKLVKEDLLKCSDLIVIKGAKQLKVKA